AATWAAKLPDGIPRLLERLRFLEAPFVALQEFWHQIRALAVVKEAASDSSVGGALLAKVFSGTRSFASGFFTTLLFLFFLLVAGDIFLPRLVEVVPRFGCNSHTGDI